MPFSQRFRVRLPRINTNNQPLARNRRLGDRARIVEARECLAEEKKNHRKYERNLTESILNDFSTVLAWPEVAAAETAAATEAAEEAAVARSAAVG